MEIGMNIGWSKRTIDDQINYMKKYGFTKAMFDSEHPNAEEIVKKIEKVGIAPANLHAPFSNINSLWQEGTDGDEFLSRIIDGVCKCESWGAPVLVVHISSKKPAPMVNDIGVARFDKLMNVADKKGVKIAFENLRVLGNLALLLEHYEGATFCWDTGHENCFTIGRKHMPIFGDRLSTLHINDNMGAQNEDVHFLPYDGVIDFDDVAMQIAKTDYTGAVLLEANGITKKYADMSCDEYYERAASAARRLADKIEEIRRG